MISDLPFDEDYYMEMNALRNIRILRIDPKDTGYGGTAGDGPGSGRMKRIRNGTTSSPMENPC